MQTIKNFFTNCKLWVKENPWKFWIICCVLSFAFGVYHSWAGL